MLSSCINVEQLSLEDIVNSENLANLDAYLPPLISSLSHIVHLSNLRVLNLSRNHLKNEFIERLVPIL